jgi:hypothetical protein
MRGVDYALARRREDWLHHPAIGDPSWDTFEREPGNPILTGSDPWTWPVNGFLFRDPPSGRWYCFVSVYPRGYWGRPPANSRILRERDGGGWEELGLVFGEPRPPFVRTGAAYGAQTDCSVVYDAGRYHLIYGWCDGLNDRGGIAYASADRPEGPWVCAQAPLQDDGARRPVLGVYVRAYASTLLKRKHDWLILHMMSTRHNGGGTWGHFAMTAPRADGPYCDPIPLLLPQSEIFHPPVSEFFPAYAADGRAYATATSVAANRTFQSVFSAPLEEAHAAGAWRLEQCGSVWHAEAVPSEAQGIWGQTFSGQPAPGGMLRAMFPAKTADDVGTIGLARRPWRRCYRDGFALSACRAPALASLRRVFDDFDLQAEISAAGPYAICFGCRGPLGPDGCGADCRMHPLTRSARVEWRRAETGWSLVEVDAEGRERRLAQGELPRPAASESVEISRGGGRLRVACAGAVLFEGAAPGEAGRIEMVLESGTARVSRFLLRGAYRLGTETWLAAEAVIGAGALQGDWKPASGSAFRFGAGFTSGHAGARAKWNFEGRGFRLYAPRGPQYGRCTVSIDGRERTELDLRAEAEQPGAAVLARRLPAGRHAVALVAREGVTPLDSLEVDV